MTPECPRACLGPVCRVDSPRWGSFWRCGVCGHEWPGAEGSATRRLRARAGALTKWAMTTDRSAATSAARAAFLRRFEEQVDPAGQLEPAERAKRADYARRAYMSRLALRSVAARRRKHRRDAA